MTETAEHPSLDEIAAYHAGALRPAEEARLQDHLVACPRCTALLLERDELARLIDEAGPATSTGIADTEDAEDWEALRSRLPRDAAPGRSEARPPASPPVRRRASPPWLAAVAASLLVATVGLAAWNAALQRRLGEASQPQLNAPIQELAPGPLRGAEPPQVLELGPDVRTFILVLRPATPAPAGEWEVEIARPGGAVLWRGRGLRPNEYGSFSLTLARRLVGEGDFVIRLRGPGAAGGAALDEYPLRIAATR